MTLSELIKHVGDDHVSFQLLSECLLSVNNGKRNSKITFGTELAKGHNLAHAVASGSPPQFVCMILWLPSDRMP